MTALKVFVLDDNVGFCEWVAAELKSKSCEVDFAHTVSEANLYSKKYDLYLIDLGLPDGKGEDVVRDIRNEFPLAMVVIVTIKNPSIFDLNALLSIGVSDYILKSEVEHRLKIVLERAKERTRIHNTTSSAFITEAMSIGESKEMKSLKKRVNDFAQSKANVIIYGEPGSGKGMVGRAFNLFHSDPLRPFITVNFAAIPKELIETELFGVDGGSPGKLALADGGDLFLDEIESIPLETQAKLLGTLDNGNFYRIGSTEVSQSQFRVISTTTQDLNRLIDQGKFRRDLYFRLSGAEVQVPPLRERRKDIPEIANLILKNLNYEHLELSENAIAYLMAEEWDGNILEMEQHLRLAAHALLRSKSGLVIDSKDLMKAKKQGRPSKNSYLNILKKYDFSPEGYQSILDDTEKNYLFEALRACQGNVGEAAKKIGMTQSVIYSRMSKHKIRSKDVRK